MKKVKTVLVGPPEQKTLSWLSTLSASSDGLLLIPEGCEGGNGRKGNREMFAGLRWLPVLP